MPIYGWNWNSWNIANALSLRQMWLSFWYAVCVGSLFIMGNRTMTSSSSCWCVGVYSHNIITGLDCMCELCFVNKPHLLGLQILNWSLSTSENHIWDTLYTVVLFKQIRVATKIYIGFNLQIYFASNPFRYKYLECVYKIYYHIIFF